VKKSPWIVCSLAALVVGQVTAFAQVSTTTVYSVTASNIFSVGKHHVAVSDSAVATFLDTGSCSVEVSGEDYTGSYTVSKGAKDVVLTLNAAGEAAVVSNVTALLYANGLPTNVTVTVKSIKFSKITLGKNGEPITPKAAVTDTVSGTLSETVETKSSSKTKTKSFSLKTLWVDWEKTSGVAF